MNPDKNNMKYSLDDYLNENKIEFESSDSEHEADSLLPIDPPNYIQDLLQGLTSDLKDRNLASITSASDLIESNLDELDFLYPDLADVLFKSPNLFNIPDYEEKRLNSLASLTYIKPTEMCEILIKRLNNPETSTGSDLLVFDIIKLAAYKLANPVKKPQIGVLKIDRKVTSHQMIIKERLKLKTKYFRKRKAISETENLFLKHFQYFVAGIIGSLNANTNHMVLAKAIYTLSELIDYTGEISTQDVLAQCVYMLRFIIKPYITHHKREVLDSCLILLHRLVDKLQNSSQKLTNFLGLANDLQEITGLLSQLPDEFRDLATNCLLGLISLQTNQ